MVWTATDHFRYPSRPLRPRRCGWSSTTCVVIDQRGDDLPIACPTWWSELSSTATLRVSASVDPGYPLHVMDGAGRADFRALQDRHTTRARIAPSDGSTVRSFPEEGLYRCVC